MSAPAAFSAAASSGWLLIAPIRPWNPCRRNCWVAMYEGARLLQLSPAGEVLRDIAVPAQCSTMPCFGGDDLRTLYLTTARHHRSAAELAAWPLSGSVLSMRVDTPGLPVNFFQP